VQGKQARVDDAGGAAFQHTCARSVERFAKSIAANRFEEVIESVRIEGAKGVLVVRGDEYDHGYLFGAQAIEYLKAVELRNLNVEKDQVGRVAANRVGRGPSIGTFGYDLDVALRREQTPQLSQRERLVIDEENA
jgi:hypothetical protein